MDRYEQLQADVDEAEKFLEREASFLSRLAIRGQFLNNHNITAKENIIRAIFNTGIGAAAQTLREKQNIEKLKWAFFTCKLEFNYHRRQRQP